MSMKAIRKVLIEAAAFGVSLSLHAKTPAELSVSKSAPSTGTVGVNATGRLASRTTAVSGGSSLSTVQSWKYNGLGLLAHHYHPRPSGASPFVVSYGYDAGLPVTQYANGIPMVTGVGYQPSGAVSSYTTGTCPRRSS
jgi:hypothetical protein